MKEVSREEQRAALIEIIERQRAEHRIPVLNELFPKQRAVADDPNQFIALLCSRRAGKTFGIIRILYDKAQKNDDPDALVVYIARTLANARSLVWRPLKRLNDKYQLGMDFHGTHMEATVYNKLGDKKSGVKSIIRLVGLDKVDQIEKLRGEKFSLVVIDECGTFPIWFETLIKDVIKPALGDLKAPMILCGTPGYVPAGFFFEATQGRVEKHGFQTHRWTVWDNPMFPRWCYKDENGVQRPKADWRDIAAKWRLEIAEEYGGEDNPSFRREWLGMWVLDGDSMMYHIDVAKNLYDGLDSEDPILARLNYVIGVDLGWHDYTAFVVVGYDQVSQRCYEIAWYQAKNMVVDDIAKRLIEMIYAYDPEGVVIDGASEGKIIIQSLASEISARFGLPVEAAEKNKKGSYVRLADSDIRRARCYFLDDSPLWRQMNRLQWDKKFQREAENQPCDLHDGWLYAYRRCMHWAEEAPEVSKPEKDSVEWFRQWEDSMIAQEVAEYEQEQGNAVDWY